MEIYGLQSHQFRPYSLRRGGATALFQETNSMETVLRWESSKVARVYITDGLSYLPSIRPTSTTTKLLAKFHFISASQGWARWDATHGGVEGWLFTSSSMSASTMRFGVWMMEWKKVEEVDVNSKPFSPTMEIQGVQFALLFGWRGRKKEGEYKFVPWTVCTNFISDTRCSFIVQGVAHHSQPLVLSPHVHQWGRMVVHQLFHERLYHEVWCMDDGMKEGWRGWCEFKTFFSYHGDPGRTVCPAFWLARRNSSIQSLNLAVRKKEGEYND